MDYCAMAVDVLASAMPSRIWALVTAIMIVVSFSAGPDLRSDATGAAVPDPPDRAAAVAPFAPLVTCCTGSWNIGFRDFEKLSDVSINVAHRTCRSGVRTQ
jgi:hypothetical protein